MVRHTDDYVEFLKAISRSVRQARRQSGYTQAEIGKMTNRTQSTVAKVESNPSIDMPLRLLYELAAVLSVPLWQIIREAEEGVAPAGKTGEAADSDLIARINGLPPHKRVWIKQIIDVVLNPPVLGKSE